MIRIYRYNVGDESYLAIDGRDVTIPRFRDRRTVHALCMMNALDGVVILDKGNEADFSMECYGRDGNPADATPSCACTAVAFADLLGVKPFHSKEYTLQTSDGAIHHAGINSHLGELKIVEFDDAGPLDVICDGEFD